MILPSDKLFFILGPCVIESRDLVMRTAQAVAEIAERNSLPVVFKASFDKANRTSLSSFRGPGMEEGLRILEEAKREFGLPVTTDIHLPDQALPVSQVADILQIPAFLCRQTDLLTAAAKTGKTVNVKKAQFLAPWDMDGVAEKLRCQGCHDFFFTERGSSFGYNTLVVDMTGIAHMVRKGYPVVIDATHSVQKPGGLGSSSGGDRTLAPVLARAGVASGASGVFLEVHPDPDRALSDGPNSLPLDTLEPLLLELVRVYKAVHHG
ncbi:MAG TPA: 3-deoxy-8-phosphooctulonate synthase [Candidatus Aminicenantes bacterium]|nr:3-deoxy-8-phosphooctulonate synthase [Candidatus Aminicenantes bacterium]HPS99780.1 3-deoxy-8-phosphooctulonate synthase [Candidatus Aminicenantes bacterium]